MKKSRDFYAMSACLRKAGPMKNKQEKRVKKDWADGYYVEDPQDSTEEEDWQNLLRDVDKVLHLERFLS